MNIKALLILTFALLFSSCAGVSVARTTLSPKFERSLITKMKVAIVPGNKTVAGQYLADSIATDLLSVGFRIIERAKLSKLLEEYKLNLSGLLENEDYLKIGKIANIDAIFIINEHSTIPNIIGGVNIKLVDLTTGDLIMSTSYSQPRPNNDMYVLNDSLGDISKRIFESISSTLNGVVN